MENEEFTISVNIAERSYRIRINRENEEVIRKAVKSLNSSVKNYSENIAYKDKQDLLALAALENATELYTIKRDRGEEEERVKEKLSEIDKEITEKTSIK
ncbi:MAG: cell division protein ZapA [Bacteroidales bacterium]|nr:cell division protein ZapA [Bacteroidales bacterium]